MDIGECCERYCECVDSAERLCKHGGGGLEAKGQQQQQQLHSFAAHTSSPYALHRHRCELDVLTLLRVLSSLPLCRSLPLRSSRRSLGASFHGSSSLKSRVLLKITTLKMASSAGRPRTARSRRNLFDPPSRLLHQQRTCDNEFRLSAHGIRALIDVHYGAYERTDAVQEGEPSV